MDVAVRAGGTVADHCLRSAVGADQGAFAVPYSLTPKATGQGRGSGKIPKRERLDSDIANPPSSHRRCALVPEAIVDENTIKALHHSQVIDLTTTGRRTGQPRKIEIFLHDKDGLLFISGMPRADRTRDWIHNITADPQVVVHLKQRIAVDIPATARVVTDPAERRPLMAAAAKRWGRTDVDEMVQHSPLVVLTVADADERAKVQ